MSNELNSNFQHINQAQIISNIERIIASYRHPWDIFTELIQNSADAIIDRFGFENISQGSINIEVHTDERKLTIIDNGIGIKEEDLSKVLVTGESIKRKEKRGKYGFMGFGLTFVAFQSCNLNITSVKDGIKASRTYKDLFASIYLEKDLPSSLEEQEGITPEPTTDENGTIITLQFPKQFPEEAVEKNLSLAFQYPKNSGLIEYILRTKSAVGLLDPIFEETKNFSLNLTIDGEDIPIENKYLTTREIIEKIVPKETRLYDISTDYNEIIKITERMPERQANEARKATLLDQKIIDIQIGTINPLSARLYISATSKENLNAYERKIGLDGNNFNDFAVSNGLWLAINGLPTGILLDAYDHASYLPFSAIVDIESNVMNKELDAGRKGITDYRAKQIRDKVKEELRKNNFIKYKSYVVGADTRISDPLYDPKKELQKTTKIKTKYDIDLNHKYFPPNEEQEVITIFTELISKNLIQGYEEIILSGYQVYDGLYHYLLESNDTTVYSSTNVLGVNQKAFDRHGGTLEGELLIEFKQSFNSIYKDIANNKKDINDIDILVCWDVKFDKKDDYLTNYGDILIEKNIDKNIFYGVCYELVTSKRQQPLPIIELKKIIEYLYGITFNPDQSSK
ncbi:ATP-binding protein [Bacillus sp. 179-I 2A5 NHS]|uniref:ATP-binding protein n=1 Tax=Bacillus sp. 179-I 2A5 NHS TaxID=3374300 RepID=UPI00387A03CC